MQPIKIILSIALFTLCTACGSEMDMELATEHQSMEWSEEDLSIGANTKKPGNRIQAANNSDDSTNPPPVTNGHHCHDRMCTGRSEGTYCKDTYGADTDWHWGYGGFCVDPRTHKFPE